MAQTYLGYPFDPEIFDYNWASETDPTLTAILNSGVMQENGEIANLISNGSDVYTIPFYKTIGGTPENYDGQTDVTTDTANGSYQSGIVYGRMHGWTASDFVVDYNSGADPMQQITSQVGKFWLHQRQAKLVGILEAIFGVTGTGDFADWEKHKIDITGNTTGTLNAADANDAMQAALGDNRSAFSIAIMHSKVAANLESLNLLNFRKYTDSNGVERSLNIADYNGLTVIVDDGVPTAKASGDKGAKYTTYLLGNGVLQHANASVKVPSEVVRDAFKNGGQETLITRVRETIHPNGFTFVKPATGYTASPTDTQLFDSKNWQIVGNPKNIAAARIISLG